MAKAASSTSSAAAAAASSQLLPLDWELLQAAGPALASHVATIVAGNMYVHGGITKHGDNSPSNKLYCFNLGTRIWTEINKPGAPALSHHACVTLEGRYMLLIGGWTGRQRCSSVHVFDCQEHKWIPAVDHGFPDGAGLSSHSAVVLATGETLIVGREGSLRIQRKHGNVYLLTGSVSSGQFTYRKMTNATASRSGHSANSVGNSLYIIGGRDDQLIEFHSGYKSDEKIGNLNSQFSGVMEKLKPMTKPPCGRKNHVSVVGRGCILIHGGETFDGRCREPVGEMYLVCVKPQLVYYKVGVSAVGRAGHVCVSDGDTVLCHGGLAGRNVVQGDCYRLTVRQ